MDLLACGKNNEICRYDKLRAELACRQLIFVDWFKNNKSIQTSRVQIIGNAGATLSLFKWGKFDKTPISIVSLASWEEQEDNQDLPRSEELNGSLPISLIVVYCNCVVYLQTSSVRRESVFLFSTFFERALSFESQYCSYEAYVGLLGHAIIAPRRANTPLWEYFYDGIS